MKYRIWHSAEGFADFIKDNTILNIRNCEKRQLYESDASKPKNFHSIPDHIKKILYLDAPDIIVECDSEPIFSIEVTTEAGTGHNAFQRFARMAAAVENDVPAIYIYPEAVIVKRKNVEPRWDAINPLVFRAMSAIMDIYNIPALLFYYPSDYRTFKNNPKASPSFTNKGLITESPLNYAASPYGKDSNMQKMFDVLNEIIKSFEKDGKAGRSKLLGKKCISDHKFWMNAEAAFKGISERMSPLTSTKEVPTEYLLNYLSRYEKGDYEIGELIRNRPTSILYCIDAAFRGDPYPGALSAIDYLRCREGKTFEERKSNLILCWGKVEIDDVNKTIVVTSDKSSINDFIKDVKNSQRNNLLNKAYNNLKADEIPRYYMQVRYGSTYSKSKHIRVYSYFADSIIFSDGALWRDA